MDTGNPNNLIHTLEEYGLDNISELSEDRFEEMVRNWLLYKLDEEEELKQVSSLVRILRKSEEERSDLLLLYVQIRQADNKNEIDHPYMCRLLMSHLKKKDVEFIDAAVEPNHFKLLYGYMSFYGDRDLLTNALNNLEVIFPREDMNIGYEGFNTLMQKSINMKNKFMETYISELLMAAEDAEDDIEIQYAEYPYWIISTKKLVTHEELVASIPLPDLPDPWKSVSAENDAEYITSLHCIDYDLEDLKQKYLNRFSRMTRRSREAYINKALRNSALLKLSIDKELFRILGPCNPEPKPINLRVRSLDPCLLHGGHRVYDCYEEQNVIPGTSEQMYEDPIRDGLLYKLEWFKDGQCDQCRLYIRKKHHALRMPLERGRWVGKYCSFTCLEEKVVDMFPDDEDEDLRKTRFSLIWGAKYFYEHKEYGIYDRL